MLPPLEEGYLRAELLAIWKPLLNSNALGVDDDFFEKGGDSLLATEMVVEAERRLGISIPDSLLFEASTVRRLAEIFSRSPEVEHRLVFPVSETAGETPLLFFHGDWTNGGFYLKEFARSLGPQLPLAAVAPHGIRGERVPLSLQEMAADRLPQILEFQPRGPFCLGGHCVGGMVALETSRLLVEGGHEVAAVAMIDPLWTSAGQPWPIIERATEGPDIQTNPVPVLPEITATPESWQRYGEALAAYVPEPVSAPVLVFCSTFDGKPWQGVSSDFTLFELPGGHYDLVTFRAEDFAARLREHLKRFTK
jgi:thioesterase domain-containing protein/acyl carrier protein